MVIYTWEKMRTCILQHPDTYGAKKSDGKGTGGRVIGGKYLAMPWIQNYPWGMCEDEVLWVEVLRVCCNKGEGVCGVSM